MSNENEAVKCARHQVPGCRPCGIWPIGDVNAAVMARLRAPFGCELITRGDRRWRIHDANDDAIASVSPREEGYARLIVQSLNEHFERTARHAEYERTRPPVPPGWCEQRCGNPTHDGACPPLPKHWP